MKSTVLRSVVLAIAVSAVLASGVLAFLYIRYGREARPAPVSDSAAQYTLGVWEGQLAVFEGTAAFPVKLYDVAVAALPVAEQQRLQTGITVTTAGELQALLEDYTS